MRRPSPKEHEVQVERVIERIHESYAWLARTPYHGHGGPNVRVPASEARRLDDWSERILEEIGRSFPLRPVVRFGRTHAMLEEAELRRALDGVAWNHADPDILTRNTDYVLCCFGGGTFFYYLPAYLTLFLENWPWLFGGSGDDFGDRLFTYLDLVVDGNLDPERYAIATLIGLGPARRGCIADFLRFFALYAALVYGEESDRALDYEIHALGWEAAIDPADG